MRRVGLQGRAKRLEREAPRKVLPRHVVLCQSNQGAIYTWQRENAERITRRPYRCLSWRHEGACARREAAVTFARMSEAFERDGFKANGWVFCVLTLDREGFYTGTKPWNDVQEAYRALSKQCRNFMARVRRLCIRNGWRSPGSDWVATVEAHKSGWPHVNLVFYAPELADELEFGRQLGLARGLSKRGATMLDGELLAAAVSTGWGHQSTAERARSRDALAGYITKIAGKLDATTGEIAKLTQTPTNAHERFRRLRSGKGFLPPRRKSEGTTGTMMRRAIDVERSMYGAEPLHKVKDPELAKQVFKCAEIEEDRIGREQQARVAAKELNLPYAQLAPPVVESYRLIGDNFEVLGAERTHDGERGFALDADGCVTWTPSKDQTPEGEREEPWPE